VPTAETKADGAPSAPVPNQHLKTRNLRTPVESPCRPKPRRLLRHPRRKRHRHRVRPLRFSPTAWAKLLFLRDIGPTEIGGFGVTPTDDLLYVEDVRLVRQSCTATSVAFDDTAVAEFFDEQVDAGRQPELFARIWLHTHPGNSPIPSSVDERTFADVFGRCAWSVMFILARGGQTYARLQFRAGPGAQLIMPVQIDWGRPFAGADEQAWEADYMASIRPHEWGADWEQRFLDEQLAAGPLLEPGSIDPRDELHLLTEQFHEILREDQRWEAL
jgi:hypothetical protein